MQENPCASAQTVFEVIADQSLKNRMNMPGLTAPHPARFASCGELRYELDSRACFSNSKKNDMNARQS